MDSDSFISYSILVCACLSIISCILLLLALILIKDFKSLSYKLISYLCITDTLTSIGNLHSAFLLPSSPESLCQSQAFLINFSILSSFFLTSVILHFLKWSIVHEKPQTLSLHLCYITIAWVLPFLLSLAPLLLNSYKKSGYWCWVSVNDPVKDWIFQILEGFGPAILVLVYNTYCLFAINKKLKKEMNQYSEHEAVRKKLMQRMVYYPFVIIICISPAALLRMLKFMEMGNLLWLEALAGDFQCLLGFGNCLVYGFTDNLKKRIKIRLQTLLDMDTTKMNDSV